MRGSVRTSFAEVARADFPRLPAITIATKGLVQTASIHETIRIKSAAWDDTGILVYTTLNHIKYALPSGSGPFSLIPLHSFIR